jgi:hypothetical protein
VIEVARDDNNNPINSCVIRAIAASEQEYKAANTDQRLSPKVKIALDTLKRALAAVGKRAPAHNHMPAETTVIDVDTWRYYYMAGTSSDGQKKDTRRKAWREARDHLLSKSIIGLIDEMVWIV